MLPRNGRSWVEVIDSSARPVAEWWKGDKRATSGCSMRRAGAFGLARLCGLMLALGEPERKSQEMGLRLLVAGTLAVLVVLGLAGPSGFARVRVAKTRVAIRDNGTKGVPNEKFTLALNGVSYDAGKGVITPIYFPRIK